MAFGGGVAPSSPLLGAFCFAGRRLPCGLRVSDFKTCSTYGFTSPTTPMHQARTTEVLRKSLEFLVDRPDLIEATALFAVMFSRGV